MSLNNVSYRELKESTDSVKEEIGSLSELSTTDKSSIVDAVNELFTSAGNGKAAIATAITGKGVTTAATDTYAQMAQNIGSIPTGITPTGTRNITANGTYDVTQYAQAAVNVSSQAPTLITKNITANGTYNASSDNADGYSGVTVNVPTGSFNCKCFAVTLSADVSGQQLVINASGDTDIAAHRSDSSFALGIIALNETSVSSTRLIFGGNNSLHGTATGKYGLYMTSSSSGISGNLLGKTVGSDPATSAGTLSVDSNGVIRAFGSSYYPFKAGNYIVVCGW